MADTMDAEYVLMKTRHLGTKGYQAPEILLGRDFTAKVDWFAVGVAIFVMLAGFPPMTMASKRDKWYKPMYEGNPEKFWRFHQRSGIPDECKPLLTGLLTKDPTRRWGYREIMQDTWFKSGQELDKRTFCDVMRIRHEDSKSGRSNDHKRSYDEDGGVLAEQMTVKPSPFSPSRHDEARGTVDSGRASRCRSIPKARAGGKDDYVSPKGGRGRACAMAEGAYPYKGDLERRGGKRRSGLLADGEILL